MGKPVAGQLGQLGQMGGGFGGQQSAMQPQMPQQNLGGYGGGMGAFQDFMRQQQQASQMPQQPAYGGFGNGMTISIAQPPQQSGGLLGALSPPQQPQQNPGGFGNQQQSQLQQALQSFRGQQQMGQQAPQMPMIGPGGGSRDFYDRQMQPQQNLGGFGGQQQLQQQQALAQSIGANQMPQQPQMPQAQRDEYNRLSAMSPDQRFATLLNQASPEEREQYNAGIQQAAQDPSIQRQYDAFKSGQGQRMDPNLVRAIEGLRSAAPQQSGFGGQPQMPQQQPQMPMISGGPVPQMPMTAPQQVRPEPPRMQAMRGIQQLANRQRGYNR